MPKKKNILLALLVLCLAPWQGCNPDTPFEHVRSTPQLRAFESCGSLETALKENLRQEMEIQLQRMRDIKYLYGPEDGDGAVPTADGGNRQEGVDYSGTNNQEAGVDEADFVKTDGYAIYVLNGTQLQVLTVPEFGQLQQGASVQIEGYPTQMLIHKPATGGRATRAIVFSSVYSGSLPEDHPLHAFIVDNDTATDTPYAVSYRTYALTKLTVIDLTDQSAPAVVRELYLEGYYQTSRRIESAVHMIAYSRMEIPGLKYWPELPEDYYSSDNQTRRDRQWRDAIQQAIADNNKLIEELTLQDIVPLMYELNADRSVTVFDFTTDGCTNFTIADDGVSRGFTSILSLDLLDESFTIDADHIVSNWSQVYASTDTLLIAEPAQDWWWYWDNDAFDEAVNIHRFTLAADGTAQYTGSGRVAGTIENQFCLSEYQGAIRIAATTGQWNRWWEENPPPPESHVYVLQSGDNNTLAVVGQVDGIAPGERIWSARFIGTRGYIVTFRNMDPLWTVDLADPTRPQIIGELDVPGVSTYIHPLSDQRLLTIGYGGDDNGLDGSIQVSLFNVEDFASPKLIDTLSLFAAQNDNQTSSWGWSEAVYEHKAFQYWEPKKMLAVPLSASRYTYKSDQDYYEYISRLMLVSVDNETGFSTYGSIDHSGFYNGDSRQYYWCNQDIRRSIFMGDFIYAISDRGITANNIDNMTATASVELPGTDCGGYMDF